MSIIYSSYKSIWTFFCKYDCYGLHGELVIHFLVSNSCRGVVEHICLIRAKEDLSEEQEKDMLDYLYTTQYQMRGIIAISLGDPFNIILMYQITTCDVYVTEGNCHNE